MAVMALPSKIDTWNKNQTTLRLIEPSTWICCYPPWMAAIFVISGNSCHPRWPTTCSNWRLTQTSGVQFCCKSLYWMVELWQSFLRSEGTAAIHMIKDGHQRSPPPKWAFWVFQFSDVQFNLWVTSCNNIIYLLLKKFSKLMAKTDFKPIK